MIRLQDVYGANGEPLEEAISILYDLLAERPPHVNISHSGKLPDLVAHRQFVRSRPYRAWFLVCSAEFMPVGSVYATSANEIGVFILKAFHRLGYAEGAINQIRKQLEPLPVGRRAWLANVAPGNYQSKALFEKLEGRICQLTYELPRGDDGKS